MDQIQTIFTFKVIIAGILLLGGSIMDIKTRRINDRIWMLMIAVCLPLLGWEMWIKGADDSPLSLLSLALPLGGMLFVLFGYPEPSKVIKGSSLDLTFTFVYLGVVIATVAAFFSGDRDIFTPMAISFAFMVVYFILYQVPIGGTRILHGGADAKCMMALAAVFPWHIEGVPYSTGPFYDALGEVPAFGYIFPVHLSTLFNGAVVTTVIMVIVLPVINTVRKDISFPRMFTNFTMNVDGITGKHVWVILEHTRKKKVEPTEKIENRLKEMGKKRVWVTPKIPFILSLFTGYLIHILAGNIMILLFLQF